MQTMVKKIFIIKAISIILLTTAVVSLSVSQAKQAQDPDPAITVSMKISEWNQVIAIIHNAPVVGAVRDPIISSITMQANQQLAILRKVPDSTSANLKDTIPGGTKKNSIDTSKKRPKK